MVVIISVIIISPSLSLCEIYKLILKILVM
jgi:hypothetical protein